MQAHLTLTDFTTNSKKSAQYILGSRMIFVGIREIVGELAAVVISFVPTVFLILILKYLRYKLRKTYPVDIDINLSNYADIRKEFDKLGSVVGELSRIKFTTDSKYWHIRKLVSNINKCIDTVQSCHSGIADTLKKLDEVKTKKPLRFLELLTEDELWQNRPSVYEYRA